MELLLCLGLVIMAAWVVWSAYRGRCVFIVRIRQGVPRVCKGTVARGFLQEIGETCGRHGVKSGVVRGVVRGRRVSLAFSAAMPRSCRQQLLNIWALSGWTAGPR